MVLGRRTGQALRGTSREIYLSPYSSTLLPGPEEGDRDGR